MHQLPPLSSGIRTLRDPELEMLRTIYVSERTVPRTPDTCRTCGGNRTFRWYASGSDELVTYECPCSDQWTLMLYLLYCGVPINYQRLAFRDVRQLSPATVEVLNAYTDDLDFHFDRGMGLYFYGKNGTGKTLLASLVLKKAIAAGYRGFFTTFADLTERRKMGFELPQMREWYMGQLRNADVLLLDDPGKEMGTDFNANLLDEVIRYRVGMSLPTLVTTNVTPSRFERRYGVSAASLLTETMKVHEVTGEDYRPSRYQDSEREKTLGLSRPFCIS
jgi:hypothetical protein